MKINKNLSNYINIFFILTLVTVVITSYYTFNEVLSTHTKKQQEAISPLYSLITQELIRPLLVAQYMANDTFFIEYANQDEIELKALEQYLKRISKRFNVLAFAAIDKHNILLNSDDNKIDLKHEKAEWFHRLKAHNEDVFTDIGDYNSPTLFIDIKVRDNNGNFIGFVGVGVNLAYYANVFSKYKQRFGYDFVLANNKEEVMLSSNELMTTTQHHRKDKIIPLSALPWYENFKNNVADDSVFSLIIPDTTSQDVITALPIEELDWQLFIIAPKTENQKEYWKLFAEKLILFLILLILIYAAFTFVVNYINTKMLENAETDQLTQLPNRHHMSRVFPEICEKYKLAAVILGDIDNFKLINDTYGHNAGDIVLNQVAMLLADCTRQVDSVVRWGGEEFVIIMPELSEAKALDIANRMRNRIADKVFTLDESGTEISITISFGLTLTDLRNRNLEDVINNADKALYQAKRTGKNRVEVYSESAFSKVN